MTQVLACRLPLLVLLASLAACSSPPRQVATPEAWFTEGARLAGLDFVHEPGPRRYWLPEIMSGGAALFDYDSDADLDLYLVQCGDLDPEAAATVGGRLYRNDGHGAFIDVTPGSGLDRTGGGMGVAVGDYDADGDLDLYVTNVGPNTLFRNNGDGTFTDVTANAGVGDPGWGTSAGFFDCDQDGDLDLMVVNYIHWSSGAELNCPGATSPRDYCMPANYQAPAPAVLYRNDGHGRFDDVSAASGIGAVAGTGLGLVFGDFDANSRLDVYVANDGMPNRLWLNNADGTFHDEALLLGCSVDGAGHAEASMGVAAADVDEDGDLDLFMTNLLNESTTLFVQANGMFDDATGRSGLGAPTLPFTGFGTGFADFDHDGQQDVFMANGKVTLIGKVWDPGTPYVEPNLLMRGAGAGRFEVVEPTGGTASLLLGTSRAAAFGDVDNDGDVDIVVTQNGGPVRLLLNRIGNRRPWAEYRVLERNGIDAIGATVELGVGGSTLHRTVQTTYSYCASNDPRVHFGLGEHDSIDSLQVRWTDGGRERFRPLGSRKVQVLRRGTGEREVH